MRRTALKLLALPLALALFGATAARAAAMTSTSLAPGRP